MIEQENIQKLWDDIDSLEKQGLFDSALIKLDSLLILANQNDAKDHMVKALFYKGKYYSTLKEDAAELVIQEFEKTLENETDPNYKRIYHSILGELYYSYANQNQYKIMQRTVTTENEENLASWSIQKIVEKSNGHYLESVKELQNEHLVLQNYHILITPYSLQDESFDLYSMLVIRAIKHFENDRNLIAEPVYAFKLTDEKAFAPLEEFISLDFNVKDVDSYRALTLTLYQKILEYHKQDIVSDRLNVERINYVKKIHLSESRNDLHASSLRELSNTSDYAKFTYAKTLFNYNDNRHNVEAYDLIKELIASEIDSTLKKSAIQFLSSIESPNLNIFVEQIYVPNKPALFHLNFNNIQELDFSIKQVDSKILEELRSLRNREQQLNKINTFKTIKSWSHKIPKSNYSNLSSELIMPALPLGKYILLTESDDLATYNEFQVSNLAYSAVNGKDDVEIVVVDRVSGLPKKDVSVDFYKYDYRNRKNNKQKIAEKTSDEKGIVNFKFPSDSGRNSHTSIKLSYKDDVLEFRDMYSPRYYGRRNQSRVYTFSDRNIYRPNQRVYLKAIVFDSDDVVGDNSKIEIVVQDPNRREVFRSQDFTNDFGSISVDFLIPDDGVTGNFYVQFNSNTGQSNGYLNFQVEEYKRPSFFVELDKPTKEYSLGDTLTLTGRGQMYSGPALSNAKIEYRITRNKYYYYDWPGYNRGGSNTSDAEIDFGAFDINENGEFEIKFELKESVESNINKNSIFIFNIEIKAIDISGETQYFNEQIRVSRKDVFISTNLQDDVKLEDLDSIQVFSKNINDNYVPFSGKIMIHSLQTPHVFKRHKYWNDLDTAILSDADYDQLLFDYKMNESQIENWELLDEIHSEQFESESGILHLSIPSPSKNSHYKVSIFNSNTNEIEYEKFVRIIDLEKGFLDKQKIFNYQINQDTFITGDRVKLLLASANQEVITYYQLEKDQKIVDSKWVELSNGMHNIEIPVHNNDKGGFFIHLTSFFNNRYEKELIKINVPHSDKKLTLQLNSFKTVVEASSEEEWTISIVDHKGANVTAEVLASMYDTSLDALSFNHDWQKISYFESYSRLHHLVPGYRMVNGQSLKFIKQASTVIHNENPYYPDLHKFGYFLRNQMMRNSGGRMMKSSSPAPEMDMRMDAAETESASMNAGEDNDQEATIENKNEDVDWSQVRNVLDETVFFYPDLVTDQNGQVSLKFKMSDALSSWKLQILAHDKEGRHGIETFKLKSIKEVAVYPNVPRFLRVEDNLSFAGKLVNSTDKNIETSVTIQFVNPITNEDVTQDVISTASSYRTSIKANSSTEINWDVNVKAQHLSGLIYRMHVGHSNGSDAIEGFIPVTTNQILITESLPIYVKGYEQKRLIFDDLNRVMRSKEATLTKYAVEYSSNPSWYVIQALPFLSNPSFKSSINILNQYVANSIGKSIALNRPELKSTLDQWSQSQSEELKSNLMKNQDLKMEAIIKTPWLRQSQSEAEQKREIIKFFSENTINSNLNKSLQKLLERQNANGGFSWISEGKSNVYISSLILENIGRLNRSNIDHEIPMSVITKLLNYIDREIDHIHNNLSKNRIVSANHLQLLYARSFFIGQQKPSSAYDSLLGELSQNWIKKELYEQAMLATVLHRNAQNESAELILKSLQEQLIRTEGLGSYWKLNRQYYSNHSTIDKHVMMIELFYELGVEQTIIDELRIWLLRNKQTNHWKTVKSTSSAVYAFLLNSGRDNSDWVKDSKASTITVGNDVLQSQVETGSLYSRHDFDPQNVNSNSSTITIENPNDQSGWGAAYIQYYDDIKNIQNSSLPEFNIKKEIFIKIASPTGPVLEPVTNKQLSPGDKLVVKLILQNDRSLEYVHIRDERASGLEPVNVLSGYKYQDALQYYEVTRDDSSNFYMSRIPRGTHVFEYELTVNLYGTFSSGMATAQCVYAPEFITHSNAIQLDVKSYIRL